MRTFTDTKGRDWTLDLNLQVAYALDQCHEEIQNILEGIKSPLAGTRISLVEPDEQDFMKGIVITPILIKLSWLCIHCNPSQNPAIQDEMDYLSGFKGDTITKVKLLMLEELADFFPQMKILFLKLRDAQLGLERIVSKNVSKLEPQLDQKLAQFLEEQEKELQDSVGLGETSG